MKPLANPKKSPASKSVRSGRNWGMNRRQAFIDFRLSWEGRLNRSDIVNFFHISTPQASLDISSYTELAPGNLYYDRSARGYQPADDFKSAYPSSSAAMYLNQLLAIETGVLDKDETFVGWSPPVGCVPTPERSVPDSIARAVVQAIRERIGLRISYLSMKREDDEDRIVSPIGLGHDGFRWHVRAYCHKREAFRDFVLGRINTCSIAPGVAHPDICDSAWETQVELIIEANPQLSSAHRLVIERDYQMKNGKARIECRQALLFYTLKRLGLDVDNAEPSIDQHIVLRNRSEVADLLNS
ncbi:MAG TPA: WYL domain-containing protein [Alcanivorax sp.]|nr:WYL domain-containing protein [Alcanivorax sp.]